jgi:hypothetical protein
MKIEHELLHHIISNYYLAIVPNFFISTFECDLFSLNKNLFTTEYEIKCSKPDFNNDFKKETNYGKTNKHDLIKDGERTNKFYFVVDSKIEIDVPEYAGLITFERSSYGVNFDRIKAAPFLHKRKANQDIINGCLIRLLWKFYHITRVNTPSPLETIQ